MHKPTYNPIKGRPAFNLPTRMTNVRHQNAHMTMKLRKSGQSSVSEQKTKDYKNDLEEGAAKEEKKARGAGQADALVNPEEKANRALLLTDAEGSKKEYNDDDAIEGSDDEEDFDSSDDESNSDEDDEQELQAELERIRAERASAQSNREQEEKEQKELEHRESAVKSNPLLSGDFDNSTSDVSKIKRRWNEDVVFKNQARDEPDTKKRFINDTVRSDFHRSFMRKFIK